MLFDNFTSTRDAVGYYLDCGLEPIPLKPNSKEALLSNWQKRNISSLWNQVTGLVNVGLRCGGDFNFAVIDCDNPVTYKNVITYFQELKIPFCEFPIIETSSIIGRHIYIKFSEPLDGNYYKLKQNIGSGEMRFGSGAYVVAPPSVCKNKYKLINGDISRIQSVHPDDLQELVSNQIIYKSEKFKLPRSSYQLLTSPNPYNFHSQSEKEQAIITGILNKANNEGKSISQEDIYNIFLQYKPNKFQNKLRSSKDEAKKYVSICHQSAVEFTKKDSPFCEKIKTAINWASSIPWRGRTGATDRAVYLAHAQIAYKKGSMPYHASCRDLAMLSNVASPNTISNANRRLINMKLISLEQQGKASRANTYRILNIDTLPINQSVRECPIKETHDVFRWGALNRSGYEVYSSIIDINLTINEISAKTGRSIKTVRYALEKMRCIKDLQTGKKIELVKEINGKWNALNVDLDCIAEIFGVQGCGENKAKKFTIQRLKHRRDLIIGKLN